MSQKFSRTFSRAKQTLNVSEFMNFCRLCCGRFEPYLKNACKRFVMELKPTVISDDNPNKDINVAFFNIPVVKR